MGRGTIDLLERKIRATRNKNETSYREMASTTDLTPHHSTKLGNLRLNLLASLSLSRAPRLLNLSV